MKSFRFVLFLLVSALLLLLCVSFVQLKKRYALEKYKVTCLAVSLKDYKEGGTAVYYVLTFEEALALENQKIAGIPLVEIKKGEDVRKIKNKKAVLFFKNNVIGEPAVVREENFRVASMEFEKPAGFELIPVDRILTLHSILDKDLQNYNEEETIKRYVRAVLERKINILYLKNPAYLEKLAMALPKRGMILAVEGNNPYQLKGIGFIKNVAVKKSMAFILALFLPLFGFFSALRLKNVSAQFALISAFSLAAAFIIAALLSETVFMLKIEQFAGVKAALLLPPLAVFFILARDNKKLFTGKVFIFLSAAGLSLLVLLVVARSGNYSLPLFPYEKELRDWFEKVFYARPRFKEYLVGHPALLLGLYIYNRARSVANRQAELVPAVFLLALGMLGQTSLINTFCHAHSDLGLSLLRTVFGLFIGILLGGMLILCRKIAKK